MLTHEKAFNEKFISVNDVERKAPSSFTDLTEVNKTNKYVPIPTPEVIADLATLGWLPIDAYQVTPKRIKNIGLQKHFIKFRNPEHYLGSKDNIELIPELLLVNSYDARCSLKFYITLHRAASNSAIVIKSDQLLDKDGRDVMNIPHKGDRSHEYEEKSRVFERNIQIVVQLVGDFAKMHLDEKLKKQFASDCCRARWDYTYKLSQPKLLLDPWRNEDHKDDLLTTFYNIQEKLTKGGWTGSGGRAIKPLNDPNRALTVNAKLFQIVEQFYLQHN